MWMCYVFTTLRNVIRWLGRKECDIVLKDRSLMSGFII